MSNSEGSRTTSDDVVRGMEERTAAIAADVQVAADFCCCKHWKNRESASAHPIPVGIAGPSNL